MKYLPEVEEVVLLRQEKAELERKLLAEIAANVALRCQVRNLRAEIEKVSRVVIDAWTEAHRKVA